MDFILPDSNITRDLNFLLLRVQRDCPDFVYDDVNIKSVYGLLAQTVWSGGRVTLANTGIMADILNLQEIEKIIEGYYSYGVTYLMVFTNPFIDESMLNDYWGNRQLDIIHKYNGGVIVNSDLLYNHIKSRYPDMQVTQSITKEAPLEENLKDLKSGKFNYVVLNNTYNKQLDSIPVDYIKHVEILINDCCPPNCKNRKYCYNRTSYENLGISVDKDGPTCYNEAKKNYLTVTFKHDVPSKSAIINEHLTRDDLYKLVEKGFTRFKVEGRGTQFPLTVYKYCKYFIKPEHELDFMLDTIKF